VLEVLRTDAQGKNFLDYGKEISQRTNRAQRGCLGGPHQAARGRQHECVFDHAHGDAALVELRGQHPVWTADSPHRARRVAIRFQNLMNILLLAAAVVQDGALSLAVRATAARQ